MHCFTSVKKFSAKNLALALVTGPSSLAVYAAMGRLSLRGGRTIAGIGPRPSTMGRAGRTIGGISVRPITGRPITR